MTLCICSADEHDRPGIGYITLIGLYTNREISNNRLFSVLLNFNKSVVKLHGSDVKA